MAIGNEMAAAVSERATRLVGKKAAQGADAVVRTGSEAPVTREAVGRMGRDEKNFSATARQAHAARVTFDRMEAPLKPWSPMYQPYRHEWVVDMGRPVTPKQVLDEVFATSTITGPRGIAPGLAASTPIEAQNLGNGHLHVEGAHPAFLPLPGMVGGIADMSRDGAHTAAISMVEPAFGWRLDAHLTFSAASPTSIRVVDEGHAVGPMAKVWAEGHMRIFNMGQRLQSL